MIVLSVFAATVWFAPAWGALVIPRRWWLRTWVCIFSILLLSLLLLPLFGDSSPMTPIAMLGTTFGIGYLLAKARLKDFEPRPVSVHEWAAALVAVMIVGMIAFDLFSR